MGQRAAQPLVVIEAPGKIRRLTALLRAAGVPADVWATRGHFRANPASLWPLALDARLQEVRREYDPQRLSALRDHAAGRHVLVATDPDQEGDVIARDVLDAVCDIAIDVKRVHLHALSVDGVRRAFRAVMPVDAMAARPGDARRVVDRLIGSTYSEPHRSVGRVFSAALGAAASKDLIIGYVTLLLPAVDGGQPFVARVPVTPRTHALWQDRLRESVAFGASEVADRRRSRSRPWRHADVLAVASGLPLAPSQFEMRT